METLTAISRWLAKQHVVTWCVQQEGELWCANAFYLFDAQKVAFYILTEEKTRHAQMSGPQAAVACFTTCCTAELEDAVAGVEIPTAAITAAMVPATAAIAAFMTEVPSQER